MKISGSFKMEEGATEWLQQLAESEWPKTVERIRLHSRASGLEVKYNLAPFGLEWSPIFWHESDQPIAWVNSRTGERRSGSECPADIGEGK